MRGGSGGLGSGGLPLPLFVYVLGLVFAGWCGCGVVLGVVFPGGDEMVCVVVVGGRDPADGRC
jgi:hypothetical protein